MLLWRYCKDMHTSFGYFGHALVLDTVITLTQNDSITLQKTSMFICMQKNKLHNLLPFFLYYILKNPAIWFAGSILEIIWDPTFCQICWWNINNISTFHFRLFLRWQNISKNPKKKKLFWGHSGPFWPNLSKNEFSQKFFDIQIIYHWTKRQKNLMSHSWENCWKGKPKSSLFH